MKMNRIAMTVALIACGTFLSVAGADDGEGKKRGEGDRPGARQREGGPGAAGRRDGGRRPEGARGGQQDPAKMVAMMIEKFDTDGDKKLNAAELGKLLESLRERRGSGMRPGGERGEGAQGRPGGRPEGGREGMRRRPGGKDGADQEAGGVKPKRPSAK